MPTDRQIEAARDSIRELSGGHSLSNVNGDYLWQTKNPINITKLLEAAEAVRSNNWREMQIIKIFTVMIRLNAHKCR